MTAAKLDFLVEQGALFLRTMQFLDQDGQPVNLTGWTGNGQMRRRYSSPSYEEALSVSINGPSYGIVQLYMIDEQTAGIAVDPARGPERQPTIYTYDVELTDPSGQTFRVLEGIMEVSPEVTR